MICPKCQNNIPNNVNFCPACKYAIKKSHQNNNAPLFIILGSLLLVILFIAMVIFFSGDNDITNIPNDGYEITQRYYNYSEDIKVYYDDLVNDPMNSEGKYTIISGRVIDILGDGVMTVAAEYNTSHPIYVKFPISNGAFGTNDDIVVFGVSKNLTDYNGQTMPYIDAELVDRYID